MYRRILLLSTVTLLTALLLTSKPARAAGDPQCFTETNQCITGRFLEFWQAEGGLAVFGYPIGPARAEINRDTGRQYLTQWFQRNRFELHDDQVAPYDVMLGRLGDDRLLNLNVTWQQQPSAAGPQDNCLWFDRTHHLVCDQAVGQGFMTYWQSHGLADPRLDPFHQSLALFGLPLTEPRLETNTSGDRVLTQWFERARFEWHPDAPGAPTVMLGLLGNEIRPPTAAAPAAGTQDPLKQELLRLVDALHQQAGCQPFHQDSRLFASAQAHADDIASHQRIDHVGTDGATLLQRLDRVHYPYNRASESIAVYRSPQEVVAAWMDEPPDGPHRLNITWCQYVDVGVGIAYDSRGWRWWVMDLGNQR